MPLRAMTGSGPDLDEEPKGAAEDGEEQLGSNPDADESDEAESDEDDDRDSDEPPAPRVKPPPPDEDRWGIASRTLAISALLGCAFAVWAQFAFRSRWIADFIENNKLESPDERVELVTGFVLGIALGGALGAAALAWLWNKRR